MRCIGLCVLFLLASVSIPNNLRAEPFSHGRIVSEGMTRMNKRLLELEEMLNCRQPICRQQKTVVTRTRRVARRDTQSDRWLKEIKVEIEEIKAEIAKRASSMGCEIDPTEDSAGFARRLEACKEIIAERNKGLEMAVKASIVNTAPVPEGLTPRPAARIKYRSGDVSYEYDATDSVGDLIRDVMKPAQPPAPPAVDTSVPAVEPAEESNISPYLWSVPTGCLLGGGIGGGAGWYHGTDGGFDRETGRVNESTRSEAAGYGALIGCGVGGLGAALLTAAFD